MRSWIGKHIGIGHKHKLVFEYVSLTNGQKVKIKVPKGKYTIEGFGNGGVTIRSRSRYCAYVVPKCSLALHLPPHLRNARR